MNKRKGERKLPFSFARVWRSDLDRLQLVFDDELALFAVHFDDHLLVLSAIQIGEPRFANDGRELNS